MNDSKHYLHMIRQTGTCYSTERAPRHTMYSNTDPAMFTRLSSNTGTSLQVFHSPVRAVLVVDAPAPAPAPTPALALALASASTRPRRLTDTSGRLRPRRHRRGRGRCPPLVVVPGVAAAAEGRETPGRLHAEYATKYDM